MGLRLFALRAGPTKTKTPAADEAIRAQPRRRNLDPGYCSKGSVLDGRPTAGSMKCEFDLAQRRDGLKEPPKPEQVSDFSILDELSRK